MMYHWHDLFRMQPSLIAIGIPAQFQIVVIGLLAHLIAYTQPGFTERILGHCFSHRENANAPAKYLARGSFF